MMDGVPGELDHQGKAVRTTPEPSKPLIKKVTAHAESGVVLRLSADACFRDVSVRLRAKREQLERFQRLRPETQDQNLALTVFRVLYLLDSGRRDVGGFRAVTR